jgi:hypothetical protein
MLFKVKNPRTLFRLSLSALALFGVLGLIHPASGFPEGFVDGARGALLGACIMLLFLASRAQRNYHDAR